MSYKLSIIASLVTPFLIFSSAHAYSIIEITNNTRNTQTITGYNITNKGECRAGGLGPASKEFITKIKKQHTQPELVTFVGKLCLVAQQPCSNYGCPPSSYGETNGYSINDDNYYPFVFENNKFIPQF